MSKYLKPMKLKQVKGCRKRIMLERKIDGYNYIRDKQNKDGTMFYSFIIRLIASLYSKYYTYKWEGWYD